MDSPIDRRSDYYRQRARERSATAAPVPGMQHARQPLLTAPNALTFARVLMVQQNYHRAPLCNSCQACSHTSILQQAAASWLCACMQVPLLVALWFHAHRLAPLLAAVTFIVAAITDWADGYLARRVRAQPTLLTLNCLHGRLSKIREALHGASRILRFLQRCSG